MARARVRGSFSDSTCYLGKELHAVSDGWLYDEMAPKSRTSKKRCQAPSSQRPGNAHRIPGRPPELGGLVGP